MEKLIICTICKKEQFESMYRFRNKSLNIKRKDCVECCKKRDKKRYNKDRDLILKQKREYHILNKEEKNLKSRLYYNKNKYKLSLYRKQYYKDNKNLFIYNANKRKARKLKADLGFDCSEIYFTCTKLNKKAGQKNVYHVDHIIPLKNKKVCGLHVPWNLQILTRDDNLLKRNKFDGTNNNESWKELKAIKG